VAGVQVQQGIALPVLKDVALGHVDDVGGVASGAHGGQLVPVALPGRGLALDDDVGIGGVEGVDGGEQRLVLLGAPPPSVQNGGGAVVTSAAEAAEDRKSTRLNSSHVSISYAVFCLKKKNEE